MQSPKKYCIACRGRAPARSARRHPCRLAPSAHWPRRYRPASTSCPAFRKLGLTPVAQGHTRCVLAVRNHGTGRVRERPPQVETLGPAFRQLRSGRPTRRQVARATRPCSTRRSMVWKRSGFARPSLMPYSRRPRTRGPAVAKGPAKRERAGGPLAGALAQAVERRSAARRLGVPRASSSALGVGAPGGLRAPLAEVPLWAMFLR